MAFAVALRRMVSPRMDLTTPSDALSFYDYRLLHTEKLWCAPELLRSLVPVPTKEGDIYSMGIVMQEIITRGGPFEKETTHLTPQGMTTLFPHRLCIIPP